MAGSMRRFSARRALAGLIAAMAGSLVFAGSAMAQAGPDTRFEDGTRVTWTAAPNYAESWRAMQDAGLNRNDEGDWAAVECTIADNRRLRDCTVFRESTPGTEVAEAILSLVGRYRASSTDRSGASSIGRRVYLVWGYGGTFIP